MSNSDKDSLLTNKIAAGVLTAGLVLWGANRLAEIFVSGGAEHQGPDGGGPVAVIATRAAPLIGGTA